jgi:hypothetical protein
MPTQYRVRAGGVTEIRYSATPETVVVLPGTRWLEKRRERESRLAAEALAKAAEPEAMALAPMIDTELTAVNFTTHEFTSDHVFAQPGDTHDDPSLTWTERMRMATTRLMKRQAPWLLSLYGQDATFDLPLHD